MTIRLGTLALIVVALVAGLLWLARAPQDQAAIIIKPPANQESDRVAGIKIDGHLSLTDHNGSKVTEKSWPGRYTLVFFGFTHCPSVCPTALQKMTDVMEKLGQDNNVQPLFITTDPERDDVAQMAHYISQFSPKIIGLTGSAEQIRQAIDNYKVYASKVQNQDESDYVMDHSSFMYLMSPDGVLVALFKDEDSVKKITETIQAKTQNIQ